MLCQAVSPSWSQTPLGRLRKQYPIHALGDGQRHSCVKSQQVLATRFASFFHVLAFLSLYDLFFYSLRRGSRIEIEDLMWVADKVTTILSNASSDRIHVRTLIGIAQLFYDFRETVAPTNLLLLGLPWSIACAEIL